MSLENLTDVQRDNLAIAAQKLLNNAELSPQVKKLLMKADPQTYRFPEIEQEQVTQEREKKLNDKIEALEQKHIEESARRNLERKHAEAIARGLDPAEVEKAITEKHIGSWETAMEHVELSKRIAAATPSTFETVRRDVLPDTKEIWGDRRKWAAAQAHSAIDDILKNRRAG